MFVVSIYKTEQNFAPEQRGEKKIKDFPFLWTNIQ